MWFLKGRRDIEEVESGVKKNTQRKKSRARKRDGRKKATKEKQEKEMRKSTRENGAKRGRVAHDVSFQRNGKFGR